MILHLSKAFWVYFSSLEVWESWSFSECKPVSCFMRHVNWAWSHLSLLLFLKAFLLAALMCNLELRACQHFPPEDCPLWAWDSVFQDDHITDPLEWKWMGQIYKHGSTEWDKRGGLMLKGFPENFRRAYLYISLLYLSLFLPHHIIWPRSTSAVCIYSIQEINLGFKYMLKIKADWRK